MLRFSQQPGTSRPGKGHEWKLRGQSPVCPGPSWGQEQRLEAWEGVAEAPAGPDPGSKPRPRPRPLAAPAVRPESVTPTVTTPCLLSGGPCSQRHGLQPPASARLGLQPVTVAPEDTSPPRRGGPGRRADGGARRQPGLGRGRVLPEASPRSPLAPPPPGPPCGRLLGTERVQEGGWEPGVEAGRGSRGRASPAQGVLTLRRGEPGSWPRSPQGGAPGTGAEGQEPPREGARATCRDRGRGRAHTGSGTRGRCRRAPQTRVAAWSPGGPPSLTRKNGGRT